MSQATDSAAIEVVDLRKDYRRGLIRSRFPALKGVSLSVSRGEIFGLLGPNGAGKTTLIKVLLGIVRKSGGTAKLLGRSAGDLASRVKVGYLPENLQIANHHTALTALAYYGHLSGLTSPEIKSRRAQLLEDVGLSDRATEPIKRYSKGMLQRLGLAQALLHDPELLILDEPTDGLDPVGRSHVRSVLNELKRAGKTIFLNSHILQEVELVCDRVAILDRGLLKAIGSVAEIAPQQQDGVTLDLELMGDPDQIGQILNAAVQLSENDNEGHRVTVELPDQAAVDQCIDQLRASDVSIVNLSRERVTLEDAFLQLFQDQG